MIQTLLRKILNSFGDKDYQYGNGRLYFLLENIGSISSKDRRFLNNLDLRKQIVYDVGAYIGLLTTFFAEKVGVKGKVIAFEPNPESFSRLLINTAKYPNIRSFNLGAGNKCEKMTMIASSHSRATGTVERTMKLERTTHSHKKWTVRIVPIDAIKDLPPPDFVKIDVEGFEYNVLQGMRNTILYHSPIIFIEIHGVTDAMKKENMQNIAHYLHNFDYSLFSVEMHKKISASNMPLTGHVLAYSRCKRQSGQN